MTDDPRALLDTYAAEWDFDRGDLGDNREHMAPAAFAALRAVLDAIDLVAEMTPNAPRPAVPVSVLLGVITRALETP